jgi:hypothetical protein
MFGEVRSGSVNVAVKDVHVAANCVAANGDYREEGTATLSTLALCPSSRFSCWYSDVLMQLVSTLYVQQSTERDGRSSLQIVASWR